MNVRYIGTHYDWEFERGKIYKAEAEIRGMYAIKDADGEEYVYPVSQFEVVEDEQQ